MCFEDEGEDEEEFQNTRFRPGPNSPFVAGAICVYTPLVNWLTRQEQLVLCGVLCLLLVGLVVKVYRTANSRPATVATAAAAPTNAPAVPR